MGGVYNINANRVLTGGTDGVLDPAGITIDSHLTGTPPTMQRAVVEEVVFDPRSLSDSDKDRIRNLVTNPTAVDTMSANSVVAVMITEGMSNAIPTRVLLPPFFQSHLMLPVQAGEQVSVLFEDFQKYGFLSGRWMSRVNEGMQVEDTNFTHGDRRFNRLFASQQRTSASLSPARTGYTPGFPNGTEQDNTHTLPQANTTNPYEAIYQFSSASLMHSYEVVPRWTKRPQEFVIQGMNNSLVVLGQDRAGRASGSHTGVLEQKRYSGAVDMVAGRGRFLMSPGEREPSSEHFKTSPLIVSNSRGLLETDKTPKLTGLNKQEQLSEGDPDYIRDAARVFVSMNTKADTLFRTQHSARGAVNDAMQPTGINYSPRSLYPTQPVSTLLNGSQPAGPKLGNAYVVGKADHVRLIARRSVPQEDNTQHIISGSVLVVKEGKNRTPEDMDAQAADTDHLAYLYMSPEGRVQIDGMQIFLGGAALRTDNQTPSPDVPRNAAGSNIEVSVGGENNFAGAEPYIKWSEYKRVIEGLQGQINALHDAYSSLVDAVEAASKSSLCVPFGSDTAWQGLTTAAKAAQGKLGQDVQQKRRTTNQSVYKSRSSKIFGQ